MISKWNPPNVQNTQYPRSNENPRIGFKIWCDNQNSQNRVMTLEYVL